ncbi:hypothetical protein [Spirochaeta lutea]|uniref:Septum formation initiator n=1 Tax=Spirochaeta lutea TaxID=1480694 RepID=A0A098R1F3_9SPIO|nr:hypothetical protein [Spirochaeta lutea]KGE73508.1 hypothetical protein DC28_02240 [Spirochaeta lutea]
MKKVSAWVAALLIPAGFLFHVFLSVNHFALDQKISRAEFIQNRLVERNKRRLTEESVLLSPQRVRDYALEELGWDRPDQDNTVHFWVGSDTGSTTSTGEAEND